MQAFSDHYQRLGLGPMADAATIKRAYRRLARRHHPDLSQAPGAEDRMAQLNEAYQVLSDPRLRASYDAVRASQQEATPPSGTGWQQGFGFNETQKPPLRGVDAHARLAIDLADAYTGALRDINLQPPEETQARRVQVRIPQGVRPGQVLCLQGRGGKGSGGGAAGDLFLEIQFKADGRFTVEGADVHGLLSLAPWEAALGAEIEVPTPAGLTIKVSVPPDSPSGRLLRLTGLGIPGEPSGDLLLELRLVLPPANDPKTRALWEVMAQELAGFNPRLSEPS